MAAVHGTHCMIPPCNSDVTSMLFEVFSFCHTISYMLKCPFFFLLIGVKVYLSSENIVPK